MESSSNDSFLWTDASNDSSENKKYKNIIPMEADLERESDSGVNHKLKLEAEKLGENHGTEIKTRQKKSKKRKCSEAAVETSYYSQPENKRIKLEPESDIDIKKKKTHEVYNNNRKNSILHNEDYLNFKVKEEQTALVEVKKRKKHKKRSSSNNDNACESNCAIEQDRENYLDLLVRQEQMSVIEPTPITFKKKKRKRSIVGSDMDITSETKSVIMVNDATIQDITSTVDEETEYTIIEEKFCAEEAVVSKPRKKKHKKKAVSNHDTDEDNKSIEVKKKNDMSSEVYSDNITNNDKSLEPTDFTCDNIVSSTIINSSAINVTDKQINKTEHLLKSSKNTQITKISDRIRFEDDTSSQFETLFGRTSTKVDIFLKVNPHLMLYGSKIPEESLITKDDEVWTLTLPHEVDLELLRNSTVSSEGKCKIKIDGQTYEGVPNEDVMTITLLTHEYGQSLITNLPVNTCINYHKRIPKVHIPDNNIMVNNQTNFTPLPETKYRHPLFGAHYKRAIKIPKAALERLQAVKVRYNKSPTGTIKKKKHKKHKDKSADIKKEEDCVYVKTECEPVKRNKKRKHSQEYNAVPNKRVKNNADSPAVWESEKAIEENLFNF